MEALFVPAVAMEIADSLSGVTMQKQGISTLASVNLT